MIINEIEIEKYGFWNDLHYRFPGKGMTVVYGPNGSGKSTLAQLMRRMVYHDSKKDHNGNICDPGSSIRFHLLHNNTEFIVQQSDTTKPVQVLLSGDESSNIVPAQHFFDSIYRNDESTELLAIIAAICSNEDVESLLVHDANSRRLVRRADEPEVRRILKIHRKLNEEKTEWFDASRKSGKLMDLLGEHEELLHKVDAVATQTATHRESLDRCEQLKENLHDLENRLRGMRRELRGHEYLQLVIAPWNQVQSIEKELLDLPEIKDFPHNGLQRLNAIEADLGEQKNVAENCRKEILELESEKETLRNELSSAKRMRLLRKYLSQADWFENCEIRLSRLEDKKTILQENTNKVLDELGEDWSIERLLDVSVGPAVHGRLLKAGQQYQNSLARRSRFRKQYKRTLAKYRSVSEQNNAFLKKWRIDDVKTAVLETRETLDSLDDYSQLKVRSREFRYQINSIREQLRRMEISFSLPPWVNATLIGFGSVGGLLAVMGIVFGMMTSSLVGTIYALLGMTCLGMSWGLKKHFRSIVRSGMDLLYDELNEKEFRLKETQRSLKKIQLRCDNRLAIESSDLPETEMTRQTIIKLAEFESQAMIFEHNKERRNRLTKMRNRMQNIQKEADESRRQWCRQLEEMGVESSLDVQHAYAIWTTVAEAREIAEEWSLVGKKIVSLNEKKRDLEMRYRETHQRVAGDADSASSLDEIIEDFQEIVNRQQELRSKRKAVREQLAACEEQFRNVRIKSEMLQSQRSALMLQAGAVDYEDFLKRTTAKNQRQELSEFLELANQDLEQASLSETEFAISQEDLEAYDADTNGEHIEALTLEIEDLNNDVIANEEELANTENVISELEHDRTSSELRFSLALKHEEIRDSIRDWIASQIAFKAMSDVKNKFEKKSQLPTMRSAMQFLDKISNGSYCNLWAQLEGNSLKVENRNEEEFHLSQLSTGFREQVALAIRLTLLESITENGDRYPLLWDDLLHQMDEEHAAVAVDVLLSALPDDQQVIYFTCHRHIVELFQNHNIPVWNLPAVESQLLTQRKVG